MLPKALIIHFWNVLYVDPARAERVRRSTLILHKLLAEAGIADAPDGAGTAGSANGDPVRIVCENLCSDQIAAARECACPPLVQRVMDLSRAAGMPIPSQVAAVFARKAAQEAVNFTPPAQHPDIFKGLKKLAAHYALVLTANTTLPGGAGLREVLDGDHVLQFFRATFFSDELGAGLPGPAPYRAALDFLKLEPRDVWVVLGNQGREFPAARQLRLPTIMVVRDPVPTASRAPAPPEPAVSHPVESVVNLAGLLQRLKAD